MSTNDFVSHTALHALYRDHHSWLTGFLRRKLGNRDHAADIAQDTFERIMKVPADALLPEPRAYLTTVARRLAISHHRRAAVERAYLDTLATRDEPVAPSPESQLLAIETLTRICEVLDALDATCRQAFILTQLEELSYAEAAQKLGITLDRTKKIMSKALQQCYGLLYG